MLPFLRLFRELRSLIYGVLNVTPDSFFDGGRYFDSQEAVARARKLLDDGADVIDIGGESTRPGADDISAEDQLGRILPVIEALRDAAVISVDTRSAAVARAVCDRGVRIINDVSGLSDPEMPGVVREYDASIIIMHSRGTPKTMQDAPCYDDVTAEVKSVLKMKIADAERAGIAAEKIMIDPGIGFGKRVEDNVALLSSLDEIVALGKPVLVGISRKSFLKSLGAGETPDDRLAGTLAATVVAWQKGARLFRTHDVLPTRRALAVAEALS